MALMCIPRQCSTGLLCLRVHVLSLWGSLNVGLQEYNSICVHIAPFLSSFLPKWQGSGRVVINLKSGTCASARGGSGRLQRTLFFPVSAPL